MPYQVYLRQIEVQGLIGVTEAERAHPRRLLIDVEASVAGTAPISDSVHDTLDYGVMAELVAEVAMRRPRHTLESLADEIGKAILSRFPAATEVLVCVEKPHPPCSAIVAAAGVRVRAIRAFERKEP
jgi:dihydroneopterin aldolase